MSETKKCDNKSQEKVEENYEKFKDFGENVRQEYEKLYSAMWSNLKASHLDPFSKILEEHEKIVVKDQDKFITFVRNNLEQQMLHVLNNAWQSSNVSEALISLEICKEKYKSYEGHKWDMGSKTPLERTRPTRMRFKENRLRYLQAQLKFQGKQLEEVGQENENLRKCIQDVVQQREYLMETMTHYRNQIQLAKPEILELQKKMLEDSDDEENVVPNKMEDKQRCA